MNGILNTHVDFDRSDRLKGVVDTDFENIVCEHKAAVERYVRTLLPQSSLVDDVVQDAFLSAFKARDQFRGDVPIRHWLLRIARHAAMRQFRRRAGEPNSFEDVSLLELGCSAGWGASSEEQLLKQERRARVRLAIARLPSWASEIIVLKDIEGIESASICEWLDLTQGALRMRLHRARLLLLGELRKVPEDEQR